MAKGKARPAYGIRKTTPSRRRRAAVVAGRHVRPTAKLQEEFAHTQEKLGDETVEVTVGGGAVKAVMNGHQKLLSITISPDVVDPEDVEMLQDMVMAAINEAVEKSQGLAAQQMQGLTGGLTIPGLM